MEITLTAEEAAELRRALDSYLGDLRFEIADTDNHDFREQLRMQRRVLEGLRDRLPALD